MTNSRKGDGAVSVGDGVSSPPCSLHEVDPVHRGCLGRDELLALLNELIEAERAGAKVARAMATQSSEEAPAMGALSALAVDAAGFVAMLTGHVRRLQGAPSDRTGAFREKVLALEGQTDRLRLLNRGQGWVVRKLFDVLPRIDDDALHADLKDMLDVHKANIAVCDALLAGR